MFSILLFLVFSLFSNCLYAQDSVESPLTLEKIYQQRIPLNQDLVMGGYFEDPPLNIKGHSRFLTTTFAPGEVIINGIHYKGVSLSYDTYSDELITFHPEFSKKIKLQPGKVTSFKLTDGSHFIFKKELAGNDVNDNGYYQLLWDRDIQVLAKHRKVIKTNPDRDEFPYRFLPRTNYFLEVNEETIEVNNGNHALRILGIERRNIRKQLREKNVNFRRDPASYLQFIGNYYSQMTNR